MPKSKSNTPLHCWGLDGTHSKTTNDIIRPRVALLTMADQNGVAAPVEDAANRQFGAEFEDIHILSNAQVAVILQVSARTAVSHDEELNDVYRKTQKYVNRFNTMTNPEKEHQELVDELDNLQA